MSAHKSDSNSTTAWTRREFLGTGMAAGAALAAGPGRVLSANTGAAAEGAFPKGFLWGVATAAHQVEGNNINSDLWVLEHMKPSMYAEPSGDACDHYHRYQRRHRARARAWASTPTGSRSSGRASSPSRATSRTRSSSTTAACSRACHEHGLLPMVTFWHFTAPRWFAALGGWEQRRRRRSVRALQERAAKHLGDLIGAATTFNEPNLAGPAAVDASPACRRTRSAGVGPSVSRPPSWSVRIASRRS